MEAKIYKNVVIGKKATLEAGVVIGKPPHGKADGELPTIIGNNAYIRSNTIICSGVTIGNNFQTGPNVFIREHNTVGDDVCIWSGAVLNPGNTVGNRVRLHVGCFMEKTTIGDDVFIGPRVTFSDDPHPIMPPQFEDCWKGATVENGVSIGAGTTLLPHVHIGTAALIGAGSVVTKDIPPYTVAFGNPARITKTIDQITCTKCGKTHYPYIGKRKHYDRTFR